MIYFFFNVQVPAKGEVKDLIDLINGMVDELNLFASELHQTTRELGTQGKFGRQMNIPRAAGTWSDMRNGVNLMSQQIAEQFVLISNTTSEVARGNLSVSIDTQNLNGTDTTHSLGDFFRWVVANISQKPKRRCSCTGERNQHDD